MRNVSSTYQLISIPKTVIPCYYKLYTVKIDNMNIMMENKKISLIKWFCNVDYYNIDLFIAKNIHSIDELHT